MPTTYDLNFMVPTTDPAQMPIVFDNKLCSGPFKLAQRVIVLLLNDKDTALVPFLGTDALSYLSGNVLDHATIRSQMMIAADRVREAIELYYDSNTPDDEKISTLDIEILSNEAVRDSLILRVNLVTVAGNAISASLPFTPPIIE